MTQVHNNTYQSGNYYNRHERNSFSLHYSPGNETLFIEVNRRKKPKVPVHAVLTATNPLIRFIGSDDMTQSRELFQVWLQKLAQWHQSTTPYLFLHTPDIAQAMSRSLSRLVSLKSGEIHRILSIMSI